MGKISLSGESIQNGCYDENLSGRFQHRVRRPGLGRKKRRSVEPQAVPQAAQLLTRLLTRKPERRKREHRSIYRYPGMYCGSNQDEILLGFDRMTDEEILYTMDNSPYPEYMGGKLKDWMKKRVTRAKAVLKKVKKKYKTLPKWAKIVTGAALAPVALAAAPKLVTKAVPALIARQVKKAKDATKNMTPAQKKEYLKKRAKRLGIAASILVPGFGITAATTAGTALAAKKLTAAIAAKKKAAALAAANQQAAQQSEVYEEQPYTPKVQPQYTPVPAAMQVQNNQQYQDQYEDQPGEIEQPKKSNLGTVLGLAALALPFIL